MIAKRERERTKLMDLKIRGNRNHRRDCRAIADRAVHSLKGVKSIERAVNCSLDLASLEASLGAWFDLNYREQ